MPAKKPKIQVVVPDDEGLSVWIPEGVPNNRPRKNIVYAKAEVNLTAVAATAISSPAGLVGVGSSDWNGGKNYKLLDGEIELISDPTNVTGAGDVQGYRDMNFIVNLPGLTTSSASDEEHRHRVYLYWDDTANQWYMLGEKGTPQEGQWVERISFKLPLEYLKGRKFNTSSKLNIYVSDGAIANTAGADTGAIICRVHLKWKEID